MGRETDEAREARLRRAGIWLQAERARRGLSQASLSRLLDVSQQQLSLYERGRHQVDAELARDVARVFKTSQLAVWVGLELPLPDEVLRVLRSRGSDGTGVEREHPDLFRKALRGALAAQDSADVKPPRPAKVTRTGEKPPRSVLGAQNAG